MTGNLMELTRMYASVPLFQRLFMLSLDATVHRHELVQSCFHEKLQLDKQVIHQGFRHFYFWDSQLREKAWPWTRCVDIGLYRFKSQDLAGRARAVAGEPHAGRRKQRRLQLSPSL